MSARAFRSLVDWLLRRSAAGSLVVIEAGGQRVLGAGLRRAIVHVHSPRAWRMLRRGSRGLARAYELGLWDSPDPVAVVRLAAQGMRGTDRLRSRIAWLLGPARGLASLWRRSTPARRRRDVAAHYDLGNELFQRMLDPTLSYSCAVFEDRGTSLEEAQIAKLERVCEKLRLGPGDRVLEIGTGWGAFALHAAATRGCHVTTTTLSREQFEHVQACVRHHGLEDSITVIMQDYRELTGRYDKLVSIEMVEAVGWRGLDRFFAQCSSLLAPHGSMLLQAITIDDRAYEAEKAAKSFINTRIFPGGCLPSLEAITRSLARRTDLQAVLLEDITEHYVTTLRCWRERFAAHAAELEGLGYDERFRRLWMLYLAYCEAGFAERRICDIQLLLAKPGWRAIDQEPRRPLIAAA